MDGLLKDEDSLVFLLAASNLPWELDVAMLRRLEKRVRVVVPPRAASLVVPHVSNVALALWPR